MQVATLTYRLYQSKDLKAVLDLWQNHSEWGGITEQQFFEWYIHSPDGPCIIIIAENESQEIIGQLALIPAKVNAEGKELKALRLSAPIIHKDFRSHDLRSKQHPAFQIIGYGINFALKKGYSLLYSLPAHGWLGLLKLFPSFGLPDIKLASFNCGGISLKNKKVWETVCIYNDEVTIVQLFDTSYNTLWKEAVKSFPVQCGIVRHASRLKWKISHHLVFEIKRNKDLVGYAAFKRKEGLLTDILARNPEDLKTVLFNSLKMLHTLNERRVVVSFDEIKLMLSLPVKQMLENIDHELVNFQFGFACYPLNGYNHHNSILPEHWYIMPDD